jgi:hypothetical protein
MIHRELLSLEPEMCILALNEEMEQEARLLLKDRYGKEFQQVG